MTCSNNLNNFVITSKELCLLHSNGFKLVPLSKNHEFTIKWGPIYDNPSFWQIDDFCTAEISTKFKNVASTLGKTHIKDSENKDLYLQVLDCDSEGVCNILTKIPLAQLSSEKKTKAFAESLKLSNEDFAKLTLLDILKQYTFVTKTRKPYGFHIWWMSHQQNKPISTLKCKMGCEFEVKTDKSTGLCTLPPSTHRSDKNFKYTAIGQSNKILVDDQLYDLVLELFESFLTRKMYNEEESAKENSELQNNDNTLEIQSLQSPKDLCFHDLSPETIHLCVFMLKPHYKEGNRHNFALFFSGTAFHSRVSETSAASIMEDICNKTNDIQEKQNRLYTLHATYKNGIEGNPVKGGPSLVELITKVSGCEESVADSLIKELKKAWQKDVPKEVTIANAIRDKLGHVKVRGTIIGLSSVYQMIKSVTMECQACSWKNKINYKIPKFKAPNKENDNCPSCSKEDGFSNTATANIDYVATVDLELQDMDALNEIERLPVKVFEKDTYNIASGEVVNIVGDLHVVRKNDNPKNKPEIVLFADSVDYVKRRELTLTEKDIKEIEDWKNLQEEQGKNILDELASLSAPELIDLDNV